MQLQGKITVKDEKNSAGQLYSALRTLIIAKFTTGRSKHPGWAGQIRGPRCQKEFARRLARSMRHHQGNRDEFNTLRAADIDIDDEVGLAMRFLVVLKTMKNVLGYSKREGVWFLKKGRVKRHKSAPSETYRRTNPSRPRFAT